MKKRILVSAGDPSGDLLLAQVVGHLQEIYGKGNIEFVGLCGPASGRAGVAQIASSVDVAVVGLWEVVKKLGKIFEVLGRLKRELDRVDSVLCVDFPDFNLKLAAMAKKKHRPVDYLIAPQLWAWRAGRMPQLKGLLRRLYPALPFEEEIFRAGGIDAKFLGHPIRDLLPPKSRREAREHFGFKSEDFVFSLMPGSRHSEVARHLPLILDAWRQLPELGGRLPASVPKNWRGLIPLAPGWDRDELLSTLSQGHRTLLDQELEAKTLHIVPDSRKALMASDFGWITSGTATLEAAYYGIPHILIYRLSGISAFIIGQMTSYFSRPDAAAGLPNILLGHKVIPELLQKNLSARALAIETIELLGNAGEMAQLKRDLRWIPKKLGEPGATLRIAQDLAALWGLSGLK